MSKLTKRLKQTLSRPVRPFIQEGGQWYSTLALRSDMVRIQTYLENAAIRSGARILIGLPNSYRFIAIYLAIIDYGAIAVPVNPKMPVSEFRSFLERCRPVCGFVTEEQSAYLFQQDHVTDTLKTIFLSVQATRGLKRFDFDHSGWAERQLVEGALLVKGNEPGEGDMAILLYTSGTTGNPKAVGLTHQQVFAAARNIILSHKLSASDIVYSFLPLFHINAQVVGLLSTCLSDGRLIIAPKFSASKFWSVVNREKVTWVSAVPAVISILLNTEKPDYISPQLRFVRSASAPLPLQHARRFEEEFGLPIVESYGMTEAASQICVNPVPPEKRVLGSVGLPTGLSLQIVDEQDRRLPPQESGEIVIRGKNVITHYVKADNQNDFRNGWFHTGDVGYVNEEGYVFIIGRKKELINHGGEKVSPYEVENIIGQVVGVQRVAVIGLKDPVYGEQVAAYIVPKNKGTIFERKLVGEILEQCRQHLSSYKCPTKINIVDEIPAGPTGKVQRGRLKKIAAAQ